MAPPDRVLGPGVGTASTGIPFLMASPDPAQDLAGGTSANNFSLLQEDRTAHVPHLTAPGLICFPSSEHPGVPTYSKEELNFLPFSFTCVNFICVNFTCVPF